MKMKRRNFLKMGAAGCLSSAGGLATSLASFNAFATDTSGYRALVCIFLGGGSDGHDLMIPYDLASNNSFRDIRGALFQNPRHRRDALTPLQSATSNGSVSDGREFALSPQMRDIAELYHNGNAAIIGNVGPLIEPTNSTTFRNGRVALPPRLFSHNDQQSVWVSSEPEGNAIGWGGRFGDIMAAAGANGNADFTLVSSSGTEIFTTGETLNGFSLTNDGGPLINDIRNRNHSSGYEDVLSGLSLNDLPIEHQQLFRRDLRNISATGIENSQMMRELFSSGVGVNTVFPNPEGGSGLAQQLRSVATVIANRRTLGAEGGGMNRQVFFLRHNVNYDTHSGQVDALPAHHQELNDAINAFYNETVSLGVADSVTTFTASEFGRTLTPNNSGTDHGWGNHHIVVGGAVNGGQILGEIPEAAVGHSQDTSRGRLIPDVAVDQFAFSLARWFGLTESQAMDVLPNARNFDFRALNGLFNGI